MQHLGVDSGREVVETGRTIRGLLQWAVDLAASGSISEAEPTFAQVCMTVSGMTPELCKDGLAIYRTIRLIGEKMKSLLCDLAS